MSIDFVHFAPLNALLGGLLIGLAVALFLLANGRIAGISGILSGLLRPATDDTYWRIAFVSGLILAPVLYRLIADLPVSHVTTGWPMLVLAGFLVGVGTRYGAGCTSGHGICGLARLSPRSIVATLLFMSTGFATVYVIRHLAG